MLVPILVATKAPARSSEIHEWADGLRQPILANRDNLLPILRSLLKTRSRPYRCRGMGRVPLQTYTHYRRSGSSSILRP